MTLSEQDLNLGYLRRKVLDVIETFGLPVAAYKSLMVIAAQLVGGKQAPMMKGSDVTAAAFSVGMASLAVGMYASRTLPVGDFRMRQRWSDLYGLLAFIQSKCDPEYTDTLFNGPLALSVRRMGQHPGDPSIMVNTIYSALISDSQAQRDLGIVRRVVEARIEKEGATILVGPEQLQ